MARRMPGPQVCAALALPALLFAGCHGVPTQSERHARENLERVTASYRPKTNAVLPELKSDSGLSNFLTYALLNQPRVAAAYYDWAASVERITVERSLPDPQLTFESDIADVVMTVMPGFMQMFPGPGKLKARANMAAADSEAKYFAFETAVLQSAFDLKKAFYELRFLDERLRISHENHELLTQFESISRAQNEVGKGMLQDVLRAQIEQARLNTEIANLEDSRAKTFAMFKAALGLKYGEPDPPVPKRLDENAGYPDSDELLTVAFGRNPRLKEMEADVRAMQASITMAYKERVPDFYLGLMADAKASPTMFRPLAGATLPIWRDKLAAQIAQAKARELAAEAKLSAEQIMLTVQVAEKSFAYRETSRNLALLRDQLIPKARQSLELARAGYLSGTIDFFNLIDSERMLLEFRMKAIEAQTQREIVLAELSLVVAGVPPPGAPVLDSTQNISSAASKHSTKH